MRVIPLRPECYREAGAMLARAFADDPLTTYTIPDPARRQRVLAWAHERWATFLGPLGGFFTTENIEAVAGWIPPQHGHEMGFCTLARSGFLTAPIRIGLRNLGRVLHANADVQRHYRAEVIEPHWILDVLGVDPKYQGQGIATALINHILAEADQTHLPCYVITHNMRNIAFYERFGFQLLNSTPLAEGVFTSSLRRLAR